MPICRKLIRDGDPLSCFLQCLAGYFSSAQVVAFWNDASCDDSATSLMTHRHKRRHCSFEFCQNHLCWKDHDLACLMLAQSAKSWQPSCLWQHPLLNVHCLWFIRSRYPWPLYVPMPAASGKLKVVSWVDSLGTWLGQGLTESVLSLPGDACFTSADTQLQSSCHFALYV